MNLFGRIFRRPSKAEKRLTDAQLLEMLGSSRSSSGARVTIDSSLTFSAVLACIRVLAESVAGLPLITYRRSPDGGKARAADHPLYPVLHDAPNPDMTSFQWRETAMTHLCLWGNAYSEIVFDGAGRVRQLWPLLPQHMEILRRGDTLMYRYHDPQRGVIDFLAERVLHILGLSVNGLIGMSPIQVARESIGLGLTLNEYGSRTFANGANPGGVLEHPNVLSEDAFNRLKTSFSAEYGGASNAGKTLILEEGMKFNKLSFPPEDTQFLESRKFQIGEIARIFRMQPHMIGDLEHATFSNIEHQSLEFVIHTLRPWLVRWEQAISAKLLLDAERSTVFAEFLLDGLLRGDLASRYQAYSIGRNWGWLSANDIRRLENMNPIANGDSYLTPLNMIVSGQPAPAAEKQRMQSDESASGDASHEAAGDASHEAVQEWPSLYDGNGRH